MRCETNVAVVPKKHKKVARRMGVSIQDHNVEALYTPLASGVSLKRRGSAIADHVGANGGTT